MAVKLRLMRMGKTKQPTYRVVASDSRSPRNGRFIDQLGTYEPRLEPSGVNIDGEKALKWIANGAQPTPRVQKLLELSGILTGEAAAKTAAAKKAKARPAKAPKTKEEPAAAAPAAASSEPEAEPAAEPAAEAAAEAEPVADAEAGEA